MPFETAAFSPVPRLMSCFVGQTLDALTSNPGGVGQHQVYRKNAVPQLAYSFVGVLDDVPGHPHFPYGHSVDPD